LVVDDDPDVLKTVRTTLERLGYAVIEAGSAEDALALAARHEQPLDLLITDVVMPEMNGRDLYAKLAASHPGIRVLFVSGYSANATGELPLLEKPFKMQELSARVREILDRGEHATGAQTVP
jgi:DNA-binding response OmpR family regulator